jgi:hypothetical protein
MTRGSTGTLQFRQQAPECRHWYRACISRQNAAIARDHLSRGGRTQSVTTSAQSGEK